MKLPQDKSTGCGWGPFKLPRWLVGKNREAVCEWHDEISEKGSNAQKFIDADRQAEAFGRAIWEVDGKKHTAMGDFMRAVVWTTRNLFWDGPRRIARKFTRS